MVCNTGTSLVPTLDAQTHHFNHVGIYDALLVMQDRETHTLWNHITGEALYGPLVGRTLGGLSNLLQMTAKQALNMDSAMQVAISDRPYVAGGRQFGAASAGRGTGPDRATGTGRGGRSVPGDPGAALDGRFAGTLGKEDTRRPRMDMGLGIWTASTHRYYPMERIRERGAAFVDQVDGRSVLIYIDRVSATPGALFVSAKSATFEGTDVRLDNGGIVRSGVLLDRAGQPRPVERPQQIFTRWYGFAMTFPGCEVFGPKPALY